MAGQQEDPPGRAATVGWLGKSIAIASSVVAILFAGIYLLRPTLPHSSPPPPVSSLVPQEVDEFIRSCQRDRFRLAQVQYPRTLSARMDQATTYGAAVDIRDTPAPPGKEIDSDDPASDPVYVQCVVGAKLVPLGQIDVDAGVKAEDDGFIYLTFTPEGVLEWSWSVTPRAPVT